MASGHEDWVRAYLLKGVDENGNLVPVLVEAGGQIQVLLRGLYAGELRTVALDDNGYLAAYVLDDENQWGDVVKVGNAELAARLGSPLTWDWRGQVQAIQDFATGWRCATTDFSGSGGSVALNPTSYFSGGYSARLTTGTGTDKYAMVEEVVGITPADTFGFSASFSIVTLPSDIALRMSIVRDEVDHDVRLRYDTYNGELEYLTAVGVWTKIADALLALDAGTFQNIKIVVDVENDVHVRALLGGVEYTLTAALITSAAPGEGDALAASFYVYNYGGGNAVVDLDNYIVTANEPT